MTQTTAIEIPLDCLVPSRVNVRKHIGDLEELKASIRALGVLQPILVRPLGDERYEIVAGIRRVAAAREIGLASIPAIVQELENGDALIASLTENIQRGNLDIDEEGEAYKYLLQIYGSVSEVARRVHKSERHIRRTLDAYEALLRLQATATPSSPAPVVSARPLPEERREGLVLPPRHAAALQGTFAAVQNEIPQAKRDILFVEVARAIAPYPEEQALRILQEFKLHPNDPLEEIISRALTPTEVRARLSLPTARGLDEIAKERGARPDDVVEEAVRVYLSAQRVLEETVSGKAPVPTVLPQVPSPEAVIQEALAVYAREKQREAEANQQRAMARQYAREEAIAVPVIRRTPERRANDLDGATWTRYSISVWNDIRKDAEELALDHPAMFPAMLAERLIQCFTTAEEKVVLDPMVGVGSTLIAAKRLGKVGIGVELSEEYARIAQERLERIPGPGQAAVYVGDARNLLNFVEPETVDFGVTSPPYWDILSQERTADGRPTQNYVDLEGNIGAIKDYGEFLQALGDIYCLVYQTLKPGAYFCVVVMDVRKGDRLYPLHSDLAAKMQEIGFLYDDLIIWDRRQEYNNLRPLGYPSVFRINRIHEYILIFRRPER